MSQQPTAKPQQTNQTKQQFQQSLSKAVVKQGIQTGSGAWGAVTTNPGQVSNVWAKAKTLVPSQPQDQPTPTATPAKGLTTVTLSPEQYKTYQQWTTWAQKYHVPIAQVFSGSPDFDTFLAFMGKLKLIRESPSLGSTAQDLAEEVDGEVAAYLGQQGVSGAAATWGGTASTATVPKQENKPAPSTEASGDQPWAGQSFTWTTTKKILKHLKDAKEKHEYPTSVSELVQYVETNAGDFKPVKPNVWQAALEGMKTRVTGGGSDLKWWSIVLEVTGPTEGRIFHYGPEHLYK